MKSIMKGKSNTELILKVMHVLAWVVFIGLCIEAGAMLISYGVSLFNPVAAGDLYKGMNLSGAMEYSFWQYTYVVSLMVGLVAAKAYAAFLVIKIFGKLNLSHPFEGGVALLIERVSHVILGMGVLVLISNAYADWLDNRGVSVPGGEDVEGFLFLAGIIFIVAQIFKKGTELQAENELTI
jgi:hypothetical protein